MFSENNKISARQIKYLLFMEWVAKLCILLPVCLEKKTFGSVIFCIILGVTFWSVILSVLYRWMRPEENLFAAVSRLLGVWPARILYVIGYLYFLVQAAVFLNLCAELASLYLLPEVPLPLLCLLPLVCGVYLGMGGIELRGRFCEVIGPVVLVLMGLMVFLSAFGMEAYVWEETLIQSSDNLTSGGFEVFACIGGMFVPLIGKGCAKQLKEVRRAGIFAGILGGSLCAIAVASYGRNGIASIDFPAVRVMSNVKIPGDFLQRWDILFLAILFFGMLATIAGSFWYMKEITRQICLGEKKKVYGVWGGSIVLSYLLAAGFLSAFTAICYYRAFDMQILIPVLLFGYIFLGIRSKVKTPAFGQKDAAAVDSKNLSYEKSSPVKRCKQAGKVFILALVLAAASFYLSGCTAREPEERLFPMALEISLEEAAGSQHRTDNVNTAERKFQLVVTYAWDDETGPGAREENIEKETEQVAEAGSADNGILTEFSGSTLMDIRKQVSAFTEQYVDYSHIKAIILDEDLQNDPDLEAQIMQWLSGEPAFASGLIVYPRQESGLTLRAAAENSSGQIGTYLEQLYKNNEQYRESSTTLGNIIAEYFA